MYFGKDVTTTEGYEATFDQCSKQDVFELLQQ